MNANRRLAAETEGKPQHHGDRLGLPEGRTPAGPGRGPFAPVG